jgi:hypothetical protein
MAEPVSLPNSLPFSRRAARRLIQRAWVLASRDRTARQHVRELRLTTLWVLEDWDFSWTVLFERGQITFDRRPAKSPRAAFTWPSATRFFNEVALGSLPTLSNPNEAGFRYEGPPELRRTLEPVCRAFVSALQQVLRDPIDENGDPLL